MRPTDEQITECLIWWPAFVQIHTQLLSTDPRTADPHDLVGPLRCYGTTRAACLLHANYIGATLADSATTVGLILAMAEHGRRPRYGREMGLQASDFEGAR